VNPRRGAIGQELVFSRYVEAAMRRARYELLKDDGTFYGEVSECRGVYASADNLAECRTALAEVLQDWILFRVRRRLPLPEIP
jgi:predicted RNase H-like HicB family nuclease